MRTRTSHTLLVHFILCYLVNAVAYTIFCTGALVTICYMCVCVLVSPLLGSFFKFPHVGYCE